MRPGLVHDVDERVFITRRYGFDQPVERLGEHARGAGRGVGARLNLEIQMWVFRDHVSSHPHLVVEGRTGYIAQQGYTLTRLTDGSGEGDVHQVRKTQHPAHDLVVLTQTQFHAFGGRVGKQLAGLGQRIPVAHVHQQDVPARQHQFARPAAQGSGC